MINKHLILTLPLLAITFSLSSCNKEITYNVKFTGINCRIAEHKNTSFETRIKAGEMAKFKIIVTDSRYSLPSDLKVKLGEQDAKKDIDYTYIAKDDVEYNFSMLVKNNIEIIATAI